MRLLTPTLIISLFLSGCSLLTKQPAEPALTSNPLTTSEKLMAEGRFGEAIALLKKAIAQGMDSETYHRALKQALKTKKLRDEELQDQLLIEETLALQKTQPILQKLLLSSPQDPTLTHRIDSIADEIAHNQESLSHCGWRQSHLNPHLAKQCISIALSIKTDNQDKRLLVHLLSEKQKTSRQAEKEQNAILEQERKNRNQERLQKATELYKKKHLKQAKELLNLILKDDPGNEQATKQLTQVNNRLARHLERLFKAGDRLYQDGDIEGAIAIWQAALNLDPSNELALEKIHRAQRVLENLESLRTTQ